MEIIQIDALSDLLKIRGTDTVLIWDHGKLGVQPKDRLNDTLKQALIQNKDQIRIHFSALTQAKRKYNLELKTLHSIEQIFRSRTTWQDDPLLEKWRECTDRLSQLGKRIETLQGYPADDQEWLEGFKL